MRNLDRITGRLLHGSFAVLMLIVPDRPVAAENRFRYASWMMEPSRELLLIEPDDGSDGGSMWRFGDVVSPARFCRPGEAFVCFLTDDHVFAYPRNRKADEKSWAFNGSRFEIVDEDVRVSLLGEVISNALLIRQVVGATQNSVKDRLDHYYLYSEDRGILAIGNRDSRNGILRDSYYLIDRTGFGVAR